LRKIRTVQHHRLQNCIFWISFAAILLLLATVEPAFAQVDDAKFGVICQKALQYVEGGFGALVAAVAGMGAIIASAAGGFRMAWALLVVSIGAFILREYVGLLFEGKCG